MNNMNTKKAFNIAGINNQLEALAQFLHIDTDTAQHAIQVVDYCEGVYIFRVKRKLYKVSHSSVLSSGVRVFFNSSLWSIEEIEIMNS